MDQMQITFKLSNSHNAFLMMILYELLEHPVKVKHNLSNLGQPDHYEWLRDEINAFAPIMRELDEENGGQVYGDSHQETQVGVQEHSSGSRD